MPFLSPRTASVLAAWFLLAGPSAPSIASAASANEGLAASARVSCLTHWNGDTHWNRDRLRVHAGSLPAGLASQITSVAALSPTDVWMLINRTNNRGNNVSTVYHYTGAERREIANPADNERSFVADWIVARSDTDVWVIGSARGILQAWQYDGSRWTDHAPARYPGARIDTAALDSNGILYLAGDNRNTRTGIILSYDGSRWTDVSPARPPSDYKALAVTADGTLIAAGGGRNDGTLQERSGAAWTTVSLSAPVNAITRVSVAPGGIVYGVGVQAGDQLVFIRQPPGSGSATVIDPRAAQPTTTLTGGAVALGLDVWLLGQDEPRDGWHHSWITHDESGFFAAGRQISQVAGGPATPARQARPCWPRTASGMALVIRSLGCSGLVRVTDIPGVTWPLQTYATAAKSRTPPQAERQMRLAPSRAAPC